MPNANKAKGNSFERKLAQHLTSVFGLNHMRVPNSGAYSGGLNAHRLTNMTEGQKLLMVGDLIVPQELSHLAFECKFYKDFSFASLLSENKQLDGWIEQVKTTNKLWFLVIKINHTEPFVVMERKWAHLVVKFPTSNYIYYKNTAICNMRGLFELNKENLLNAELNAAIMNSNENSIQCSQILPVSGN